MLTRDKKWEKLLRNGFEIFRRNNFAYWLIAYGETKTKVTHCRRVL